MNELIGYVLAGKIRMKVLHSLRKVEKTPSLLAREIQTHQSTTSRTLSELEKQGLVRCLTPDAKLSRLYTITERGKKVIERIDLILK